MKKPVLLFALAALCIGTVQYAKAQKNTAFAITGKSKGNLDWVVFREVDLNNGSLLRNIYIPLSQKPKHIDATNGKEIADVAVNNQPAINNNCNCTQTLSAASAYDAKQNRLYFINLLGSELQYIDLNQRELKIFHVKDQKVKQFVSKPGEQDNITRMAFASDGYGYALTNDGNHLIRFSTGKNIHITDLGSLKDGDKNSDISVHTQAASWGGDMVADDGGNLYLFTTGAHVFKINPSTMVADLRGTIKGLPMPYSVNAAAVDKDGQVVVSSSLNTNGYYRVNMSSLDASPIQQKEDKVFNASDFANGNFIACGGDNHLQPAPVAEVKINSKQEVTVSPNPVENKTVHLYFNNIQQGKSLVVISEVGGKKIATAEVLVSAKGQTQTVELPTSTAPGMYVVRVVNADKSVFSQNVLVK